jgi:hypothetical protein
MESGTAEEATGGAVQMKKPKEPYNSPYWYLNDEKEMKTARRMRNIIIAAAILIGLLKIFIFICDILHRQGRFK